MGAMFASHASGSTLGVQHERGLRIRGDAAVPFARGDATAGDRERACKPSSLKKHVNGSSAEGDQASGSRPATASQPE